MNDDRTNTGEDFRVQSISPTVHLTSIGLRGDRFNEILEEMMKSFEHSQAQVVNIASTDLSSIINLPREVAERILARIDPKLMGRIPCDRPLPYDLQLEGVLPAIACHRLIFLPQLSMLCHWEKAMSIKTIFGGCMGVAIALMLGLIMLQRLDQVYATDSPQPLSFMVLLATVGAVTGGAIASPVVEVGDD